MTPLNRLYRTMRFGEPIIVVSGLPRAGTSMAMRMLEAGGIPIMSDGIRLPDENNPRGYFEYERVKELDKGLDKSWLEEARGRAIKIISFLLRELPDTNNYRVIFMHREMDEIIASQNKMLAARGEPVDRTTDGRIVLKFEDHLRDVRELLVHRSCIEALDLHYREVVACPLEQAERIAGFLGGQLDVREMATVIEPTLYRNRA